VASEYYSEVECTLEPEKIGGVIGEPGRRRLANDSAELRPGFDASQAASLTYWLT